MSRRFVIAFLTVAPVAFLAPRLAHAGLSDCGDINVSANAMCTAEVKGGCTAKCESVSFKAACEGKLEAECDAKCSVTVDASCTGSCETDCSAKCTTQGGSFDCNANCTGTCGADCDTQCAGQASGGTASGSCAANCKANCSAKCSGECNVTPPTATCDAKCKGSCQGSCSAKVNAVCQANCRGSFDVNCEATLKGGCTVNCDKPDGQLFCSGEYVDTGDHLSRCADALKAALNIQVMASGSAECEGGTCTAEGKASVSACATSPGSGPDSAPVAPGIIVLGAIGAAIARRVRRGGS